MKYLLLLLFFTQNSFCQQDTIVAEDSVKDLYDTYVEEVSPGKANDQYNQFLERNELPDSVLTRRIPDSLLKKIQADEDFWYANSEIKKPETKKNKARTVLFQQQWFQTLLWIVIIGGFAGFLIWYLAGSNIVLFRKKKRTVDENLTEELSTEDLFAINYQKEIDKAIAEKNHRLATRLLFLRLLKDLSERNIIDYKQGKTNFDYLVQLQSTRYYPDFFRITRNYEYSWYGQFEVSAEKFALIKKDFDQFENRLYH